MHCVFDGETGAVCKPVMRPQGYSLVTHIIVTRVLQESWGLHRNSPASCSNPTLICNIPLSFF